MHFIVTDSNTLSDFVTLNHNPRQNLLPYNRSEILTPFTTMCFIKLGSLWFLSPGVISFENGVEFSGYLRNHVTPSEFRYHMSGFATFILTSSKYLRNLQHNTSLLKTYSSIPQSLIVWNILLLQISYFIITYLITYKAGRTYCINRKIKKIYQLHSRSFPAYRYSFKQNAYMWSLNVLQKI